MFHTFLNRKIQRGIIKIMNILYKIGDLYNLLVDALFWLLYDKIGIKKVKRFYLNVLILISIPTLLLVMLSFVFSLELAFDPYRLVGIFGKKTYSMLITLRRPAYVVSVVAGVIFIKRTKKQLRSAGLDKRTRLGLLIFLLMTVVFVSGKVIRTCENYIYKHYGEAHTSDYIDYEFAYPNISVEILTYPNETWFQKALKTQATFERFVGEIVPDVGGKALRTEEVPEDWWRLKVWRRIAWLEYHSGDFFGLVFCWWPLGMAIGAVRTRPRRREK